MSDQNIDIELHKFCRQNGKPIIISFSPSELDADVLTLVITTITQPRAQRFDPVRGTRGGCRTKKTYPSDFAGLLRPCRHRPRGCRTANKRNELASSHCQSRPRCSQPERRQFSTQVQAIECLCRVKRAVGRIPFNPPSRMDRRVKGNPPYANWPWPCLTPWNEPFKAVWLSPSS
jgi:hypothetical protein